MFAMLLNRTPRHRLLISLLLLTGLLAAIAVRPAPAQQRPSVENDTVHRYGWGNVGIGGGRTGFGFSAMGALPVGDRLFVGGRYVHTTEIRINLSPNPAPNATTWDAGPLIGFVEQGRYGHLSVGTGVAVVDGQRPDERDPNFPTLGVPLDVQAFFTPIRPLGIGVHGYANVNPEDNLVGVSFQLQVRIFR